MTQAQKNKLYRRLSSPAFYVALLGAAKLGLNAFGVHLISDDQVNEIANGLATLTAVIGVAVGYETTV